VNPDDRPLSEIIPDALAEIEAIGGPGPEACLRCGQPVARPYELRPDGQASTHALYCDACIDRCHEATDFAHICKVCAAPGEVYP